jgi:NAD(P)-dependent dehydrogenase (short-subunit alcohol dehydrogenase family)
MQINDSIALVTGANRGLGARLVRGLLDRGARTVYATSRAGAWPAGVETGDHRVRTLVLDITDQASVEAAAKVASDVTLLVNNAGVLALGDVLGNDLDRVEEEMRVNYTGTLRATRAFVPVLRGNGGGTIANVLTILALAPMQGMATYSASKAAAHSMTQALRAAVREQGITVLGAYPAGIDTDMLAGIEAPKADPAEVATRILDAVAGGQEIVFPDDISAGGGAAYQRDPAELERMLTG